MSLIKDEALEAIVQGDVVEGELVPLAWFAHHVRVSGEGPPPLASAELAILFTPAAGAVLPARTGTRLRRLASVAVGGSIAAVSLASAAAAGVLPDPASDAVRDAVETLTPIDFSDRGGEPEQRDETPNTNQNPFGERVSNDATGESDGDPGVDGQQISEEAPGADHRPEDPGPPPVTGHDRAAETPAAPHLPDPPDPPPAANPELGPPPSTGGAASPSSTVPPARDEG